FCAATLAYSSTRSATFLNCCVACSFRSSGWPPCCALCVIVHLRKQSLSLRQNAKRLLWFSLPEPCQSWVLANPQLNFRPGFRVSVGNAGSQAAVMVLPAGAKEGGPDNRHQGADQWLFVVEGMGVAIING